MNRYSELDVVEIRLNRPDCRLQVGSTGVVVHVYPAGQAYEVEFFDAAGHSCGDLAADEAISPHKRSPIPGSPGGGRSGWIKAEQWSWS